MKLATRPLLQPTRPGYSSSALEWFFMPISRHSIAAPESSKLLEGTTQFADGGRVRLG